MTTAQVTQPPADTSEGGISRGSTTKRTWASWAGLGTLLVLAIALRLVPVILPAAGLDGLVRLRAVSGSALPA